MSQAELKSWDDLYPGRFYKAADLGGRRPVVEISRVYSDSDLVSKNDPKGKVVLAFKGMAKELALNATHRRCLIGMFGPDPQAYVGKRLVLCEGRAPNPALGEEGPCVRFFGSPDLTSNVKLLVVIRRGVTAVVTMMAVAPPAAPGPAPTTGRAPSSGKLAAATPTTSAPPITEAEVLDLQARINACADPAELEDLKREARAFWHRMPAEAQAAITLAIEQAGQRPGMSTP